jgi:hypothetical protein
MAHATDAHLPLLHRLQERRLRLRGRAIDLVGEHHVGEQRPFKKPQLPRPSRLVFLEHVGADDVGRHQVGGELDAAEGEVEALGQRADEERLGKARHALEQTVATAEQADQQLLDHLALADDHPRQLGEDAIVRLVQAVDGGRVEGRLRHGGSPVGTCGSVCGMKTCRP